jgi:hypothetical protein
MTAPRFELQQDGCNVVFRQQTIHSHDGTLLTTRVPVFAFNENLPVPARAAFMDMLRNMSELTITWNAQAK